ncbi:hypothetical protein PVL29_012289 [Vitis rotundifolia]|uniref:Folate-biopterin transporter 3 n=1 Tax=Vitis rotundifolia TaxID=103349 RepID=A0AA38ZRK2_VITRO|nr:hypothetical protein PVL29_012289 [Vitis rotundifolia]
MDEVEETETLKHQEETHKRKNPKVVFWNFIWRPVYWFRMLGDELHWSFVLSVVIVYGINQGLSVGLSRVSTQYYMKDEQKVQPSEAQAFFGMIQLPWVIKPLWGLLTDILPIIGYRRRPYFIFAGFLGVISMLSLALHKKMHLVLALLSLMTGSAGIAIADVTIDACVAQNSISHPSLAGDMQSLCGLSSSIGALVGYSLSGFLVHFVGPKVNQKFLDACKAMWTTLKCREVWRPCLYMYLSLAVSLNVREGMFYWYTDAKGGPSFSKEVVGSIFSIGAVGSLLGVLLYQNVLKNHPFRDILFWTQLLYGLSGMLDLILVLRINLKLGISDYFFAVIDEAATHMIGRVKWMPLLVLSSKLCPPGIEGTFFALLMSIDNVGMLSSSWAGGLLLHVLEVTRTQFDNLWLSILIRSMFRIIPLGLLFLVPRSEPNSSILPTELLRTKKGDDMPESDNIEMAPLVNGT